MRPTDTASSTEVLEPQAETSTIDAAIPKHGDERVTRLRIQRVLHDFGQMFSVSAIDSNLFVVSTPFAFANGDSFSIIVERRGAGWRLTDRGATVARFTATRIELAKCLIALVTTIVESSGLTISDAHVISADFDELPSPHDLANLIQVEAQIGALHTLNESHAHQ